MSSDFQPEILSYAPADREQSSRLLASVRVLLAIGWAVCAVGTVLILVKIESVTVSGPILGSVGLTTCVLAAVAGRKQPAILGSIHVAVCGVFVAVVYVWNIGPRDATIPFLMMAAVYTVAMAWPTKRAFDGLSASHPGPAAAVTSIRS